MTDGMPSDRACWNARTVLSVCGGPRLRGHYPISCYALACLKCFDSSFRWPDQIVDRKIVLRAEQKLMGPLDVHVCQRDRRELVPLSCIALRCLKNKVSVNDRDPRNPV